MVDNYKKAENLFKLEKELNTCKFQNVEIGSIMAIFGWYLFNDSIDKRWLRHLVYFVYLHIKAIRIPRKYVDYSKKIIYFKTGQYRHYQLLEQSVTSDKFLSSQTLILGSKNDNIINSRFIMGNFAFRDILISWAFLLKYNKIIRLKLNKYNITRINQIFFFILLFRQLLKVQSVLRFFRSQSKTIVVSGDYDRGLDTAVWFSVAKAIRIKSFSLQHGVINPPYGYSPLIADEIWVWGAMAKKQLMELGVNENSIKIVGTPIIKEIKKSEKIKKKVLKKLGLKCGRNIILALSTPNYTNDRKLVTFFNEIRKKIGEPEDNFLVKLHPARKTEDFLWIIKEFNLKILPNPMNYIEFMNLADIILTHSSGIATEALFNEVKIGILDILDCSPGNGLELNKYMGVPLIKTIEDFLFVVNNTIEVPKEYISDCIGNKAKIKIKENIYEHFFNFDLS